MRKDPVDAWKRKLAKAHRPVFIGLAGWREKTSTELVLGMILFSSSC
jgi:hypothetical protein